jgi:hypothetical protein
MDVSEAAGRAGSRRERSTITTRTTGRVIMSSKSRLPLGRNDTAIVFIDPQNEVLSEKGAAWGAVGASVTENKTVENMERIFQVAKQKGFEVFISPHYFYPTDNGWRFNGPLEMIESEEKVRSARSAKPRWLFQVGRRLARAFQAVHRGRKDDRC